MTTEWGGNERWGFWKWENLSDYYDFNHVLGFTGRDITWTLSRTARESFSNHLFLEKKKHL